MLVLEPETYVNRKGISMEQNADLQWLITQTNVPAHQQHFDEASDVGIQQQTQAFTVTGQITKSSWKERASGLVRKLL